MIGTVVACNVKRIGEDRIIVAGVLGPASMAVSSRLVVRPQ